MRHRAIAFIALAAVALTAAASLAEPIIKPRKYHGPIPPGSLTLRIGFLGGPENQEMIDALDRFIQSPFEAFSEDFGNALTADLSYVYKVHPQFAVRTSVSGSFLRTSSDGFFVPQVTDLPDTVETPVLDYERDFDVDLFVIEASALYFFTDAAVNEFQPYAGGGFSVGVPHASFKETRVDRDTGEVFEVIEKDRWSNEAGVHGILGASYYTSNVWAVNVEARFMLMQSKFPILVPDRANDTIEEVDVDVDYSGFMINFGVTRAF